MEAELQTHMAFHLTGRRRGGQIESLDELRLLPLPFAGYRNLAELRYDFPLVLFADGADEVPVQSLSGLIDSLLQEVAQGPDGQRLRRHGLRLEQEIRAGASGTSGRVTLRTYWDAAASRLAGHGEEPLQDSLRRLRAALKRDGEVVDCDEDMPFRLLRHIWAVLRDRNARKARDTIDELAIKLSDILAAEFVRTDEGLSPEWLKAGMGSSHRNAFDFAVMSRLLSQAAPKTPLPEGRRRRIRWLLSVLTSQRFFPASKGSDAPTAAPYEFVFESCAEAVDAFRARLNKMTELAKALAMAELEVEGRYNEAKHDRLFDDFASNGLSPQELALFPDYLILARPDEIPAALNAFAVGLPAKVLVQSDDLLQSSALAGDGLALALGTKHLATTAVGLSAVFVLQSSSSGLMRLRDQILRGFAYPGPALFNVFSGASAGAGALPPYLIAAAAAEARVFPTFVYDPSAGPDLASRFQAQMNPQSEADWPLQEFAYEDEQRQRICERLPFTLIDFVACDRRYARHFACVPRTKWNGSMVPVSEFLGPQPAPSEKVPCLLMVDDENVLQKVIVDVKLIREARRCGEMWRGLQELGGIRNSHAMKLLAEERKAWAEQQQPTRSNGGGAATASAAPTATAAASAAVSEAAEAKPASDEPYIETARCSSCDECIQINSRMFAYDKNKQASIVDPDAGTYRQLVEAAENCQVAVIHPGKPRNPNEPGLEELLKRAEPFL